MLAVTSATLAVTAHAVAGGGLPDAGITVLLTLGVAGLGVALADRRRRTTSILAVLAAAQLATHVLLSVGSPMGMSTDMSMDMSPAMLCAHVVAVLLSALLLAGADGAVFAFAAALAMLLPTVCALPPVPDAPVAIRLRAMPRDRAASILLCRAHARRGPPAVC